MALSDQSVTWDELVSIWLSGLSSYLARYLANHPAKKPMQHVGSDAVEHVLPLAALHHCNDVVLVSGFLLTLL